MTVAGDVTEVAECAIARNDVRAFGTRVVLDAVVRDTLRPRVTLFTGDRLTLRTRVIGDTGLGFAQRTRVAVCAVLWLTFGSCVVELAGRLVAARAPCERDRCK